MHTLYVYPIQSNVILKERLLFYFYRLATKNEQQKNVMQIHWLNRKSYKATEKLPT